MTQFEPGQRVRVSYVTTYRRCSPEVSNTHFVDHPVKEQYRVLVREEHLSPVGPEDDAIGTVRLGQDGSFAVLAYRNADGLGQWMLPSARYIGWRQDDAVRDWKIIFTPNSVTQDTDIEG